MHADMVPNRTSRAAILLRETWREDGPVRKRTIANLTGVISEEQALDLRRVLKGETLIAPGDAFEITRSLPHGHVKAVLLAMKGLGLAAVDSFEGAFADQRFASVPGAEPEEQVGDDQGVAWHHAGGRAFGARR